MKVLIIKTSSMGDIIHTLPALSDAMRQIPGIEFDWVVEEGFQEIPSWHPAVRKTIPIAIRRWRKNLFKAQTSKEWKAFKNELQSEEYDCVIDAQGLIKSAFLCRYIRTKTKGQTWGLDKHSAREPFAAKFYKKKIAIKKKLHAVDRVRNLFAQALHYKLANLTLNYGIRGSFESCEIKQNDKQLLFFHSTTWPSKHWPESSWQELISLATEAGYKVSLAWGNEEEKARANRLANNQANTEQVEVLEPLSLKEIAAKLRNSTGVVAVDTGLAHLTAAMHIPSVSLFGPTNPGLTAPKGPSQTHLVVDYDCAPCLKKFCPKNGSKAFCKKLLKKGKSLPPAPCYETLTAERVWNKLYKLILKES